MLQLSFPSSDNALLVRDTHGNYVPASVEQILEAARQAIEKKMERGAELTSPPLVKEYLRNKLAGLEHEVFAVLFLDTQNRLIEYIEMFRGTIGTVSVHSREVVKEALRLNAAKIILAHNHPSGSAKPSEMDKRLTQHLKGALALIEVPTLDHIIVAGNKTVSFAESGLI